MAQAEKTYLQDRYASGKSLPSVDTQQNVDLLWGKEMGRKLGVFDKNVQPKQFFCK